MDVVPDSEAIQTENAESIRHRVRGEYRIYLVLVAVISLIVGGVIGKYVLQDRTQADWRTETTQPPSLLRQNTLNIPTISMEEGMLSVYVSGAVNASRVVTVPQGSLVVDAIEAVGGASDDANLDAINLAAPLRNHDHIQVPGMTDPGTEQTTTVRINLNTATAAELEVLPHIGPTRAQQIVAYRESHGPFQGIEDIMLVSGIGQGIYEEIASYIYIGDE
jgi:competence protein ComEA